MRNVKFVIAGAMTVISGAAFAADLPLAPPPYIPPIQEFGGWYLRGDIGFSNQQVERLNNALDSTLITQNQRLSFDSAGIYRLGVGYQVNSWFRTDVTGEYRGNSNFNGLDLNTFPIGGGASGSGADNYHGSKSEWLVLANAYFDLGTWWCITPFVGAGVGGARVTISGFTDQGLTADGPSSAFADTASKWNLAWALHAGLAYKISPGLTMEFAYRYVDMGDGITGDIRPFDGPGSINNPMTFKHITSHDLTFGARWAIDPVPVYQPPLVTKG